MTHYFYVNGSSQNAHIDGYYYYYYYYYIYLFFLLLVKVILIVHNFTYKFDIFDFFDIIWIVGIILCSMLLQACIHFICRTAILVWCLPLLMCMWEWSRSWFWLKLTSVWGTGWVEVDVGVMTRRHISSDHLLLFIVNLIFHYCYISLFTTELPGEIKIFLKTLFKKMFK